MKITVKFMVFDLPPGFGDAVFELEDGATVAEVFDASLGLFAVRGVTMDEKELRTAIVMRRGKWVEPDAALSDGDALTILRPMDGG